MTFDEVKQIDARARERFSYKVEEFNLLHWRSHADAVRRGEPWHGPCGDLTSTVLDLATNEGGVPLTECFRIIVGANGGFKADHIVACIKTSDRGYVIFGDTGGPPYPASRMPHRPLEFNRMDEAGPKHEDIVWRYRTPWEAEEAGNFPAVEVSAA